MELIQMFATALVTIGLLADVGIPMIEGTWEIIKEAANVYQENIMPVRKQFSSALYNAYDAPAKNALVEYLKSAGHTIEDDTENYTAADVISTKKDCTYYNEAEIKLAWTGDWPTDWEEIRILERKTRLLEKYEDADGVLNFYIFRKDLKQAWRIKDTSLTKDRLREAYGRNIVKGEQFYHIPYTEATLINIGEAA